MIPLHHLLLPYLYGAFRKHVETGQPVLRNLFFYDQEDPQCRKYGDQFLAGDDLLVCPVVEPGLKTLSVYLPAGGWYDFWTGKAYAGKQKVRVRLKADRLPIFVRAGAILPTLDPVQHTAALSQVDTLHLSLFLADEGESTVYWDAGDGYGYQIGQHTTRHLSMRRSGKTVTLEQRIEGDFNPAFQFANIRLVGLGHAPGRVTVDDELLPHSLRFDRRTASVVVPFGFRKVTIE